MINIDKIRKDFPILNRTVNGKPLVYFDNAATSQTPQIVIDTIVDYYSNFNANILTLLLIIIAISMQIFIEVFTH